MPHSPANLISLEAVSIAYGVRPILSDVSLGVLTGDRIGVVGRNGDGKTTLLRIMAGLEQPQSGRVTRNRSAVVRMLAQHDDLRAHDTVRGVVVGERADHEWASDPRTRGVVEHLLAGLELDRQVDGLSGGERRRVSLARLLLDECDLLLLDEPTNHLDVEGVAWLADHLRSRRISLVVVTHDRWFLDAVCSTTWEVHDATIDTYDGGYAAYVLARAERARQADAADARRANLMRKELAWLRRGAPARTSKPKFRLDAANALIAGEPPARDTLALQQFASARLGKDVLDLEDVTISRGRQILLDHGTWRIGPGDRLGLVGVNGAGKTTLLQTLAGELPPAAGRLRTGRTVRLAHLPQSLDEIGTEDRVLASVEAERRVVRIGRRELTATSLLEQFGFTGDRLTARIGDLSGGERRRLQLLRLLLGEPNVLLLDEPTNDLDIETLTVVEDFLDDWPGTLVVVSHDRYFLERVCDSIWALLGGASIGMLPGGVDEYLARRSEGAGRRTTSDRAMADDAWDAGRSNTGGTAAGVSTVGRPVAGSTATEEDAISGATTSTAAAQRAARKEAARIERQLAKLEDRIARIHAAMAEHATDAEKLVDLDADLALLTEQQRALEEEWLVAADAAGPSP
jgi:ATP-binding cassette subfamily F protein uup